MKRPTYKKTQKAYAADFGCDVRTIRRYQAKGYPLDDPEKMGRLLVDQKHQPEARRATDLTKARLEKVRLECERLAFAIAREKREYVSVASVREEALSAGVLLGAQLNALVTDLPGQIAGLSEIDMHRKLKGRIDQLKSDIKRELAKTGN